RPTPCCPAPEPGLSCANSGVDDNTVRTAALANRAKFLYVTLRSSRNRRGECKSDIPVVSCFYCLSVASIACQLLLLLGRDIPVLSDFAILDAEHVEPGRRVLLPFIRRIVHLAHERQRHKIPFGLDRHEPGQRVRNSLRAAELGEVGL